MQTGIVLTTLPDPPSTIGLAEQEGRRFRRIASLAVILGLLVLVTTFWSAYSAWDIGHQAAADANASRRTLQALTSIVDLLRNAETGQRGFLLTGRDTYLEPYNRALQEYSQASRDVELATAASPDAALRIDMLQLLLAAHQKMDELAQTVQVRRSQGLPQALAIVETDRGRELMQTVRRLAATISRREYDSMTARGLGAQRQQQQALTIAALGSLFLFILLLLGFLLLDRGSRRRIELTRKIEEARRLLEVTLRSIGDGVIATDAAGHIDFMNEVAQQLTGWTFADAHRLHLDRVFVTLHEESRAPVPNPVRDVLRTGNVTVPEMHTLLVRRDGVEIPIDDRAAPIRYTGGDLLGAVLIFRGIEDRRKSEAALKLSNRRLQYANEDLQQFAYAATHDLQEPLRTIVVFSQLLERRAGEKLDADELSLLQSVREGGLRMSKLITELLEYSRDASIDRLSHTEPVDVGDLLAVVAQSLAASIQEAGATINFAALPTVLANPSQLIHLLQNLLSNAIKYRRPGVPPSISITADSSSGIATFRVSDNGLGFDSQYANDIFMPFRRLHDRNVSGTGIGLSLCRRIVERHGGRIWAESVPDRGSTFFFTLPLADSGSRSDGGRPTGRIQ